jgi:5'-AMP-activated protein kinase catalytic alpha subunit
MENRKMQRKKSIIDLPSKADFQIGPFKIINEIGEGEFATVFSGIHEGTDEKVAIKQIKKSRLKDEALLTLEINIHKKLFHPNICQLYCVIETEYYYFLVMELCPDGNVLEIIEKEGAFDEEKACRIFQQIISGLEYLHKNFICHRDMKPENIIIQNKDSKNIKAKIVDFGFSKSFAGDKLLNSPRGSPFYAAPEILQGRGYKGNKIDIWSSGVILYTMVYGDFPFNYEDMKDLVYHIKEGKYSLPDTISKNCQDLIKRILQIDPDKRINLYDIKNHPWMKQFKFDLMKSPGIYINEDILPVDLQIIREMAENNESEIHEYINDIIKNKHNSNTVSYYLRVNKKIAKGEISISDLSSASFLFLSYIDNEISKKKYWNDNLDDRVKSLEEELYKDKLIEKENINPKIQLKLLNSNKSEGDSINDANINSSAINLQKNISQFKKNRKKDI